MPVDDELLNKITWKIPNALALVGSRAGDERNAMTTSWITQVAMEPVLIAVGVDNAAVFRIKGQSNLEFGIDRQRCAEWNVNVADVLNVIETAVGGKAFTQMIEGEKSFDVTLRWPAHLRQDLEKIKQIPVDVLSHAVPPDTAGLPATHLTGATAAAAWITPRPSPRGRAMPR